MFHKQRASVGGIIPYQKSQYVGIASFISNQSMKSQNNFTEYKFTPEFTKKALIDNANMPLQSGGGMSDSSREVNSQVPIKKSISQSATRKSFAYTTAKNLPKLDSKIIGQSQASIETNKPIQSARVCSKKTIAFGSSRQPRNERHFKSFVLKSSVSPNLDTKSQKSHASIVGPISQAPSEKLSLEQKIFYEKRLFNIPPPLFSSRGVLEAIKLKKKKKKNAAMSKKCLKYSVQQSQLTSMYNTAKTRNNIFSAGSYSIASDEFNHRQSTDEDGKRYYYTNPDNASSVVNLKAEIVIEDNPYYEEVKIETQHSQESLIDDSSLNADSSSSSQEDYEEVKTEEITIIATEALQLNEVKEDSSSSHHSQLEKAPLPIQSPYKVEEIVSIQEQILEQVFEEVPSLKCSAINQDIHEEEIKVVEQFDLQEHVKEIINVELLSDEHAVIPQSIDEQNLLQKQLDVTLEENQIPQIFSSIQIEIKYPENDEVVAEAVFNEDQDIFEDQNTLVIDLEPNNDDFIIDPITKKSLEEVIKEQVVIEEPLWIEYADQVDMSNDIAELIYLEVPTEINDIREDFEEQKNEKFVTPEDKCEPIEAIIEHAIDPEIISYNELTSEQVKYECSINETDEKDDRNKQSVINAEIQRLKEEEERLEMIKKQQQREEELRVIDESIVQLLKIIEYNQIQTRSDQELEQSQIKQVQTSKEINPFDEIMKTLNNLTPIKAEDIGLIDFKEEIMQQPIIIEILQEYKYFNIKETQINQQSKRVQASKKSEQLLQSNFIKVISVMNKLKLELLQMNDFRINLDLALVSEQFKAHRIIEEDQERQILASRPSYEPYQTPSESPSESLSEKELKIEEEIIECLIPDFEETPATTFANELPSPENVVENVIQENAALFVDHSALDEIEALQAVQYGLKELINLDDRPNKMKESYEKVKKEQQPPKEIICEEVITLINQVESTAEIVRNLLDQIIGSLQEQNKVLIQQDVEQPEELIEDVKLFEGIQLIESEKLEEEGPEHENVKVHEVENILVDKSLEDKNENLQVTESKMQENEQPISSISKNTNIDEDQQILENTLSKKIIESIVQDVLEDVQQKCEVQPEILDKIEQSTKIPDLVIHEPVFVEDLDELRFDKTYFNMASLSPIQEEPLQKEFSAAPIFKTDGPKTFMIEEPENMIKVVRFGRAGAAKKGLNVQALNQPQTFTVEFVEQRQDKEELEEEKALPPQSDNDAGLLSQLTDQVLDNQSKQSSSSEDDEEEEFVFLTDLVPGQNTLREESDQSSDQSIHEDTLNYYIEPVHEQVHLETLKEDSNDYCQSSHLEIIEEEDAKSNTENNIVLQDQEIERINESHPEELNEVAELQLDQEEINIPMTEQEIVDQTSICDNEDDLIMGFLDGTHLSGASPEDVRIPQPEVYYTPQDQKDDLSNKSERCNSQNLSDLGSDHEFYHRRNSNVFPREILAPTFENMKRMQLKIKRQENSLATSNLLEQLGQFQRQSTQQEEHKGDLFEQTAQQANRPVPFAFPTALRPSLQKFKKYPLNGGARSTYHEPLQQPLQQPMRASDNLAKSMYSAQTTQSVKIGMLMKGLDGGSVFMRHALKKAQKSPNMSQLSGQVEYNQMGKKSHPMLFNNQQLGSDSGSVHSNEMKNSSDNQKSTTSNNNCYSHNGQIFMSNPQMMGFGMYAAAGFQIPSNLMQQQTAEQPPHDNEK